MCFLLKQKVAVKLNNFECAGLLYQDPRVHMNKDILSEAKQEDVSFIPNLKEYLEYLRRNPQIDETCKQNTIRTRMSKTEDVRRERIAQVLETRRKERVRYKRRRQDEDG